MEFPVDYGIVTKLTECRIVKIDITLFTKAEIMVMFYSADGRPNVTQYLVMDQSNGYNEWNSDDNYLIEWVKTHIQPPK
jgi:hypothetical protein